MLLFTVQRVQGIQYICFALIFGGMLLLTRKNRSIMWLFCNYLLGSVGMLVPLLQHHVPAWLANILGMEIPQLRYALLHLAFLEFTGTHRWTRRIGLVLCAISLPFYLYWSGQGFQDPAFSTNNFAILDLVLGIQTALSGWVLLQSEESSTRMPRIALSVCLFLYSLVEWARLLFTICSGLAPLHGAPWLENLSLAIYVMASSATPAGIIWLFNQRLITEFKQQSIIDPLTGLLNRRGLEQAVTEELDYAIRSRKPLSIVIADVDHFKAFNDLYGHAVGDTVLRSTASVLRSLLRKRDLLARLGGEEFVLVLPKVHTEDTAAFVEKLRAAVEQNVLDVGGNKEHITLSFGITHRYNRPDIAFDQLLKEADIALYQAKQAGRNQAMLFLPEQEQQSVSGVHCVRTA